jgi:hypothetical protein
MVRPGLPWRTAETAANGVPKRSYLGETVVNGRMLVCGGNSGDVYNQANNVPECWSIAPATAVQSFSFIPATSVVTSPDFESHSLNKSYAVSLRGLSGTFGVQLSYAFGPVSATRDSVPLVPVLLSNSSSELQVVKFSVSDFSVGQVLRLATPDGEYVFRGVEAVCSAVVTPSMFAAGLMETTECVAVAAGESCSWRCKDGYILRGARMACMPNGQFSHMQSCSSTKLWQQVGSPLSLAAARKFPVMAYCAATNRLYLGFGSNTSPATRIQTLTKTQRPSAIPDPPRSQDGGSRECVCDVCRCVCAFF